MQGGGTCTLQGALLPNILKISEYFRQIDQLQIFTQHGHTEQELSGEIPNQLVRKWSASGSVAKASRRDHIGKNTYDAFIKTKLDDILKENGIERVIVCGVMTDCCCNTTARSAFNRGYETWLLSDGTGSANKTQHEAGLRGFGFAFGEVMETKKAVERLEAERQS
ncbi:Isochorismatase hydrolase [Tothia fuscella]|uniref:Isochorismatase hydrolase n=1 Tax=Tothia fuscella TaxID=1048955 RepID=A0A9P4NYM2_9PEZI|nr:Isochorismatase hydrolase [Tothia fuscella]